MTTQNLTSVAGHAFIVTDALGNIADHNDRGLFVADTRFLSRYQLQVGDADLVLLRSGQVDFSRAQVFATNVGVAGIADYSLELIRDRRLSDRLIEEITLTNRAHLPIETEVIIAVGADLADIFEVRALLSKPPGGRTAGRARADGVTFRDRNSAGGRQTIVSFTPAPRSVRRGVARFSVRLEPAATWRVTVTVAWEAPRAPSSLPIPVGYVTEEPLAAWLRHVPALVTEDVDLRLAYQRAIRDLASLELVLSSGHAIPAAGIPWYMAIFGRDSIITSLQTLLLGPRFALGTLRTLASYQADSHSDFRDAEPGKMPHEVRFGALAESGQVPHSRYYGSVDVTPLWLVLLAETYRWTNDLRLLEELLPAAERALRWIEEEADLDGDGLVEYRKRSPGGLDNQAWKDSWDSVRFADGRFAEPPIAPVEAQGYVYAARLGLAGIYDAVGRQAEAEQQRDRAARLRRLVHEAFWMPAAGFYALALDGRKRQVDSITSNPGHLLWSGLPEAEAAGKIVARLMAPDCFSGWGIRTMASGMKAYSPISYHNGSVWPHDTGLILAGFRRYGFHQEAAAVADGLIATARWFGDHRLPELFCGYDRAETHFPVDYPVACSPQAWAAGSVIQLIQTLAGIAPDAERLTANPVPSGRDLRLTGVPWRGGRIYFDASDAGPPVPAV